MTADTRPPGTAAFLLKLVAGRSPSGSRRLEAEGLVIYRPNAGAQVAPADPGLFDEEMTVLAVLEGYGTALAAPCMGAADIARLSEINDEMAAAMAELDTLRFGRLNQEFHGLIYERCPNAALVGMQRGVWAAFVDEAVELLVEAPEPQRVELGHRGGHLVVDLAQPGDVSRTEAGRGERGPVALEDCEHGHLLVEEARVRRRDLRARVG